MAARRSSIPDRNVVSSSRVSSTRRGYGPERCASRPSGTQPRRCYEDATATSKCTLTGPGRVCEGISSCFCSSPHLTDVYSRHVPSDIVDKAPWWQAPWVLVTATLTPAGLLLWSSAIAGPWLSGVLANMGVTVLLLVPAALYADWHRRALSRVENKATQAMRESHRAATAAEGARADVGVLADAVERLSGAQEIEEELRREQLSELEGALSLFDQWGAEADRASTINALSRAVTMDLISADGFRSPLFETELHLRFRYGPNHDTLSLSVEHADATVLESIDWPSEKVATDVYRQVEHAITASGQRPAVGWTLSIHAVEHAAKSLRFAVQQRAMPIMHGDNFHQIVEFIGMDGDDEDGWYITDRIVFPKKHMSYTISISRLGYDLAPNTSWEDHIGDKGWLGFTEAFKVARALNGIPDPAVRHEAD
jgi:hypothetical protein